MADGLYGVKQASKTKTKEISSSTSLAFSSNLASLITKSSSSAAAARPRQPKTTGKSDIFTAHNKNVKKRAAADILDDGDQKHKTKDDIGAADSAMLHRSKRRLEEKARLYDAMKRGEYIGRGDGFDDRGLVDFDRKWAEKERRGSGVDRDENGDSSNSDDNDNSDPNIDDGELVSYEDEFGRTRKGTKAQAAREERRRRIAAQAATEAEQLSARPTAPSNIIYGDTVQHQAFNPDNVIAERMANIAKKRDRSATPPPESHYDAGAEVRTKGTGFYGFSGDAETRKKEMENLERERLETEKARAEREEKKEARKRELMEREEEDRRPEGQDRGGEVLDALDMSGPAENGNGDGGVEDGHELGDKS